MAAATLPRGTTIGLIAFLTLVDLFAAQALLPSLALAYNVSPSSMGIAVNACTLGMAVSSLLVALVSRRIERRRGIWISLGLLSVPTALLALAPNLAVFAALRILQGIFMAAAFALTLAYLGEFFSVRRAASAFAAYVTGNVASNLFGRLLATTIADHFGTSGAFSVFALLNLSGAVLVLIAISRPARASAEVGQRRQSIAASFRGLREAKILSCLGVGFCILFAFIGTFTYVNFVLVAPPFDLGMMRLGLVYLVFMPSILTTPLGGRAAGRFGTRATLWMALGLAALGLPLVLMDNLPAVVAGLAVLGVGTFLAQAAATGFMNAVASFDRGFASGLYLASYFVGGLVGSVVLGRLFDQVGWTACVAGIGGALAIAALLSTMLKQPNDREEPAGMLQRHETDRNSAVAAVAGLGQAPVSSIFR